MRRFSALIILFIFFFTVSTAQRVKKTTKPKAVVEKEDFSQWMENPICKAIIADSIVVDVDKAINHVFTPSYMGRVFVEDGINFYENDLEDLRLFTKCNNEGKWSIYRQELIGKKWSNPEVINMNCDFSEIVNPFMMPDGQTLYFSAKSLENNGSFSLYTTSFDITTNTFLSPQKLPYPFCSDSDDLWFIDDEDNNIAWLISTRNQPEGKACIYIMRIQHPWEYYDAETIEPHKLKRLACITSIKDTWVTEQERQTVIADIEKLQAKDKTSKGKINFVVNDNVIYQSMDDFRHKESVQLYNVLQQHEQKCRSLQRQIDEYRRIYHKSPHNNRQQMGNTIQSIEMEIHKEKQHIYRLANEIRKIEYPKN